MADTSVTFTDASGVTRTHDARQDAGSELRPVVVLGADGGAVTTISDPAAISGAATGGTNGAALNVNTNAIQKATYHVTLVGTATGALTAATFKPILSIEHAATATKNVRIRRVRIAGLQTTALAGLDEVRIVRGTAASTGGTAVTPTPTNPATAAAETTCKTLPTIVAATVLGAYGVGMSSAANQGWSDTVVYDWQEGGETQPIILRAGNLDAIAIGLITSTAKNYTVTCTVTFTEE